MNLGVEGSAEVRRDVFGHELREGVQRVRRGREVNAGTRRIELEPRERPGDRRRSAQEEGLRRSDDGVLVGGAVGDGARRRGHRARAETKRRACVHDGGAGPRTRRRRRDDAPKSLRELCTKIFQRELRGHRVRRVLRGLEMHRQQASEPALAKGLNALEPEVLGVDVEAIPGEGVGAAGSDVLGPRGQPEVRLDAGLLVARGVGRRDGAAADAEHPRVDHGASSARSDASREVDLEHLVHAHGRQRRRDAGGLHLEPRVKDRPMRAHLGADHRSQRNVRRADEARRAAGAGQGDGAQRPLAPEHRAEGHRAVHVRALEGREVLGVELHRREVRQLVGHHPGRRGPRTAHRDVARDPAPRHQGLIVAALRWPRRDLAEITHHREAHPRHDLVGIRRSKAGTRYRANPHGLHRRQESRRPPEKPRSLDARDHRATLDGGEDLEGLALPGAMRAGEEHHAPARTKGPRNAGAQRAEGLELRHLDAELGVPHDVDPLVGVVEAPKPRRRE